MTMQQVADWIFPVGAVLVSIFAAALALRLYKMTYDLNNALDRERFKARVNKLFEQRAAVELTAKTYRSGRQNRYLHALLGALALETGNTLEYTKKIYYKRMINPDIFVLKVTDKYAGEIEDLRSSADLTTEEMSMSIDRLKRWAAQEGIYLPEEGDEELLRMIEIQMDKNKTYLY